MRRNRIRETFLGCTLLRSLVIGAIGASIVVPGTGGEVVSAAEPPATLGRMVRESDLIVVARVIGLIDTKPVAQKRRHQEAHWIEVEKTLKGSDEAGRRLRARPRGLSWEDGSSYVLFLERREGDWVDAIPQPLLRASQAQLAAVTNEIATQGGGVGARRVVWVRYTGGWGAGLIAEFFVTSQGEFEWRKRRTSDDGSGGYDVSSGSFPAEETARLIRRIEETGPGPVTDDAGIVDVRWDDADGEARQKSFLTPDQPPSAELLEQIELMAHRYGRTR